ncbi:MAG: KGG domain-containing protein [Bacteroidales bacterium]
MNDDFGDEIDRRVPVILDDNAPDGSPTAPVKNFPGAEVAWRAPAGETSLRAGGGALVNGERKERRGFASMSPEKQREIASKGGRAAHQKGTAHEWTSDEARQAGRKGGQVSRGGRGRLVVPDAGTAHADLGAVPADGAAVEVARGD